MEFVNPYVHRACDGAIDRTVCLAMKLGFISVGVGLQTIAFYPTKFHYIIDWCVVV